MSYLLLPDLIAILWMAIVLSHLRSRHATDFLHLWIIGLGLIVVEGVARILYVTPMSPPAHATMHVVALDGYFLAGFAFFQSATGKLRYLRHSSYYLLICMLPSVALISAYGAGLTGKSLYPAIAITGLAAGLVGTLLLRRPPLYYLCLLAVWIPVIEATFAGEFRGATYLLLFDIYAATSIAFCFTLPRERWGRAVVIAGFALWSLCFLSHPWIAMHHPEWVPMAAKIWDLQKFIVTFGLLIVTLEEDSAAKEYQALHDILTGLPNRRLFRDRLTQALSQSARKRSRLVLFNIDLDGFKEVNDRWGHDCGDALLLEIATRLGAVTRQSDTLARMGGDEFHLLIQDFCPEADASTALEMLSARCALVMESFRSAVEKNTFTLETSSGPQRIQPSLSIGGAIFPDQAGSFEDLCRLADQNMYADKRSRAAASGRALLRRHSGLHLATHSAS